MSEEWRDIPRYEGLYQVSNRGRVRSVRDTTCSYVGRVLKPDKNRRHKYYRVTLFKDGVRRKHTVHRLVALAFLGPIPKGKQVNHKNGDRRDNRPENIEYVTPSENLEHARTELGKRFGNYKLSEKEVRQIRRLYKRSDETWASLAEKFGVSDTQIGRIVKGESWSDI